MAPRLRTTTVGEDQRPSSSSGPSSGRVSARHADLNDKRKSRDDLLIGTMTAEKQRFQSFHVPIRGNRLPSPPQPGFSRSQRQHDVRASDGSQGGTGVIAIGMALGSPSHAPTPTGWQPQLASVLSPNSSDAQESQGESTPKTKSRKWGLFRSKSKAKKKAQSETNSPQPTSTPVMSPAGATARPNVLRSDSVAVNSRKHKPLVVRSNTEPIMAMESGLPSRPNQPHPRPPHRPVQTTPARYAERPAPAAGFHLPKSRGPLLDVEIPDITMERYSVMFGQVLDKKRASRDQSSLLARRQATLSKLKTIDDEPPHEILQPPRRMSSLQAKNSPTFHLFPPTPKRTSVNQAQSPRLRSNTSPAGLPSPNQTSFNQTPPRQPAPRSQTFPHIAHGNHSTDKLPNATAQRERRPTLNSRFQRSTPQLRSANNVFDSPTSIDESPVAEMKATYQPHVKDPAWEMISPPPSTTSSHAGTPKKGSLSSITSNENISVVKPSQPQATPEEIEAENTLRQAVEASITRQISVSRDQRQLLGSLRGNGNRKRRATDGKQPIGFGPTVATGGEERLVETAKKLTPTVVHPEPEPASGEQPRSLHMHRRSERVIVEGA